MLHAKAPAGPPEGLTGGGRGLPSGARAGESAPASPGGGDRDERANARLPLRLEGAVDRRGDERDPDTPAEARRNMVPPASGRLFRRVPGARLVLGRGCRARALPPVVP